MKEEMMDRITEAVGKWFGDGCQVQSMEVVKNNGHKLCAVVIMERGAMAAPLIYVDGLLCRLDMGAIDEKGAVEEIVRIYTESLGGIGHCLSDAKRLDKETILGRVSYQVVNAGKNRERLHGMPHSRLLDLAAVYRVDIGGRMQRASFAMTHRHCIQYGIGMEEIDKAARRNTELEGFDVRTIPEVIAEFEGMPVHEVADVPMFVLTNSRNINGAAVLLYPMYFGRIAGELGDDLYVLPSSTHEVIAVPATGFCPAELALMVRGVNASEVNEEDFLSNSVYRYCKADGSLAVAYDAMECN